MFDNQAHRREVISITSSEPNIVTHFAHPNGVHA